MPSNLQAPTLLHKGQKKCSNTIFWQLPQDLMSIVFNKLDTKSGAQIKLMCLLLGTCGNGSFAVSEKFVTDTCGISECGYKSARKALTERGWLIHDKANQRLIVDIEAIYKDGVKPDIPTENKNDGVLPNIPLGVVSNIPTGVVSDIPKGLYHNTYNIEDIERNKENNTEECSVLDKLFAGVDEKAYAAAKTKEEKLKALGF